MTSLIRIFTGVILLSGCVQFTTKVDYSVSNYRGLTQLTIYRSEPGFYTNIHGGKDSDSYQFEFPSGLSEVRAGDIQSYYFNYQKQLSELDKKSHITIILTKDACDITLNLYSNENGNPLSINGHFRQMYCGQIISEECTAVSQKSSQNGRQTAP